jgi:hypothetical protein
MPQGHACGNAALRRTSSGGAHRDVLAVKPAVLHEREDAIGRARKKNRERYQDQTWNESVSALNIPRIGAGSSCSCSTRGPGHRARRGALSRSAVK